MFERRAAGKIRHTLAGVSAAAMTAAVLVQAGGASAQPGAPTPQHRHAAPHSVHRLPAAMGGGGHVSEGRGTYTFPTHGPVTVMLQLDAKAAVRSFVAARPHGIAAAATAARDQRAAIGRLAAAVRSHLTAPRTRAHVLFTLRNVYAGIAVRTDASRIAALGRIPGVAGVRPMPAKYFLNVSSVPLINAPQTWAGVAGDTGKGIKIGIIDTGIDYTHADFGGTGSSAAYQADHRYADSSTLNVPSGDFPSKKVVGGIDLVGDKYDASSPDPSVATPHQDPNPLDCNSHGTHVAGTAAGYGVNPDGTTYTGGYDNLASLTPQEYQSSFRIGPGVAPQADLYAIKVFGCSGSTNVVSEALDWAADPNGDGNFNDHLDVVNMSLGSDYGVPDDPDSVASNNASLLGITVVAAEGNGGDLVAVGGSPGDASRAIGVAASQDALTVYDAMQENSPAQARIPGQRGVLYDWAANPPVTADVVAVNPSWQPGDDLDTGNADGCQPFTGAQAAAVKGKIAWEEWQDTPTIKCGSLTAAGNAEAAGAVGVILTDNQNIFAAGINGAEHIPTFQIRKVDADALRPAADAGTLNVTLTNDLRNSVPINDNSLVDQVAAFSSRGIGDPNNLKPDVTAPGMTIFSAANGTGDEGMTDSGTSMATPHITGVAALVKAAHPDWYPEQIKAAIMNTADNPVWSDAAKNVAESPIRAGAGRVDAERAAAGQVLAYSFNSAGSVSLSYGSVAVSPSSTRSVSKQFKVENDSNSDQTYDLNYVPANSGTDLAGVSFDYPPSVTVPAHGSSTVLVTLHVDGAQLSRSIDAARAAQGPNGMTEFVTEASGWLELAQGGTEQLRLPVYAAPRPVSTMAASRPELHFGARTDTAALALAGKPVDQNGFEGMVSGYELGAVSPRKPDCTAHSTDLSKCVVFASDRAGDLHYVGATSDANLYRQAGVDPNNGLTYFAVAAYGSRRAAAGYVEYDVAIDTNGDGQPDAIVFNVNDGTDVELSAMVDAQTGALLGLWYLNGADGSIDTNPFNNNVMVLPVPTGALSDLAPSGKISYWVEAYTIETGLTDTTRVAHFNFLHPALSIVDGPAYTGDPNPCFFCGEQFFGDEPTGKTTPPLTVLRDRSSYGFDRPKGLLLLHPYNAAGTTAEVVRVNHAPTAKVSFPHNPARYGSAAATVTVTGLSGLTPTGTVRLLQGARQIASGRLAHGSVTFRVGHLGVGRHALHAVYLGDGNYTTTRSGNATLRVGRAAATVSWTATPSSSSPGQLVRFQVSVRVSPRWVNRAGQVKVFVNGTLLRTMTVRRFGHGTFATSALPPGRDRISLHYLGTRLVAPGWFTKPYRDS
jgi:subtilisin family serine protease